MNMLASPATQVRKGTLDPRLAELLPRESDLLSVHDVVSECQRLRIPMTLRTLQFYATSGLIDKPLHVGREAFYEHSYIFDHLACIYILRSQFGASLGQILRVLAAWHGRLKEVLIQIEGTAKEYSSRRGKTPVERYRNRVMKLAALNLAMRGEPIGLAELELEVDRVVEQSGAKQMVARMQEVAELKRAISKKVKAVQRAKVRPTGSRD